MAGAVLAFVPVLNQLYQIWSLQPEYSHGVIVPVLAAFLVWRQRAELRNLKFAGSWYGLIVVAAGLGLRVIGYYSTMHTIERYAFLLVLYGLVLTLTGPAIFRRLWMPLAVLIFMVPLPISITQGLSLDLQLMSSALGVALIRLAGISVYLEGNIIDLGSYQLQVAEACSGLRYLFPLMTLAFLAAFMFRGPFWKRALIFVSSVPITILMNSLRIGFVGITVEMWGYRMAEGLLHDAEGWLVFMFSTAAVLLVAYCLARFARPRVAWSDAFNFGPSPAPGERPARAQGPRVQPIPLPFLVSTVVVTAFGLAGMAMPEQREMAPERADLLEFPTHVGGWVGQRGALEEVYLNELQLDDYLLADYRERSGPPINFYVAYYQSQRGSRRVHSPANCMPGGGWQILTMEQRNLPGSDSQASLLVNRAVVALGDRKEIVYYWFQERGRRLTDENTVKWYLFWDALTRHRTDGALVRVVAPLGPGASEGAVDQKMEHFLALVQPQLSRYIPD
jgi:exosortase D (VPLPA-CTERM-specific)